MNEVSNAGKWERADKAFNKGVEAYIEFGQELAVLNADGTTQEEIGQRYQMSQSSVRDTICVGRDGRISSNTTNLPKSQHSLYLLTTLDDAGFEKLAKPDTTQADIKAYKESIRTPKPTPAPAPDNEGENDMAKNKGYLAMAEDAGLLIGNSSASARNKVKEAITRSNHLQTALKVLTNQIGKVQRSKAYKSGQTAAYIDAGNLVEAQAALYVIWDDHCQLHQIGGY